jgi:hypothetical protein
VEIAQLEQFQAARKERRLLIYSRVYVTGMDRHVALTELQRQQLLPIVLDLLKANPSIESYGTSLSLFGQSIYRVRDEASDAELSKVLETSQHARWARVVQDFLSAQEEPETSLPDEDPASPILPLEPEADEAELSNFLYKSARRHAELQLARITLLAEDISRTASLSAKASSALMSAAKGAFSEIEGSWKTQLASQVALSFASSQEPTIAVWLRNNNDSLDDLPDAELPEKRPLWVHTLASVLSPAERAAWEKEVEARARFRSTTMISALTNEFDRICPLSEQQWNRLQAAFTNLVGAYGVELEGRDSSASQGGRWYLEWNAAQMLFAGLESELKSILTQQQWSRWSAKPDFQRFANSWRDWKRRHDERIKKATGGAASAFPAP